MTILLTSAQGHGWELELDDEGWPLDAELFYGQLVQRRNLRSGEAPKYRFKSRICGWYRVSRSELGYVCDSLAEPGCIQIYPEAGLEALS